MASQALYRKWRSTTFEEIIGQQHVTQTLINALKLDRVAHAYLFAGPRGTGKTSTARLLAKAVNCLGEVGTERPCNKCAICISVNEGRMIDLIEIDAASNTGVDDIRDLRDKVNFRPAEAKIKFYIIDEVHMLSNSAFNALLKTLEEPPEHVIFVLATTEPEKIPATITSRCQRFDFKRIRLNDIAQRLAYIAEQEGVEVELAALEFIARQGSGSMRDAISLLDQMVAYGSESITLDLVHTVLGVVASQAVIELIDALIDGHVATGLDIVNNVVSDGVDPRQFAREIVEYLRAVMLVKLGDAAQSLNLPDETLVAIKAQATRADAAMIVRATERFNMAQIDIKSGLLAIPQLPLELALVQSVSATAETRPAAVPVPDTSSASETRPATGAESGQFLSPEPASTKPGAVVTAEAVMSCFEQVINTIEPRSKPMAEALRHARLHRVEESEIYFVTFDFMKQRFDKAQPREAINKAFSQALGHNVSVRFLSDNDDTAAADATAAKGALAEGGLELDESTDALLKMATEELGGEIVE